MSRNPPENLIGMLISLSIPHTGFPFELDRVSEAKDRMKGRKVDMSSCLSDVKNHECWYLVHCQPRKEHVVTQVLQHLLNIAVYFPQCRVSSTGRSRYTAFFPGYIFAQIDLHKVSLGQINTIPGVLHIVGFGGAPSPIPHRIVQEIAQRVQYLDQFPHAKFSPGDPVRFKQDGALQDLEMMFVGPTEASQRVRVLLTLLGRQKEISVDIAALEKLPANPVYRRKRYTRGKGRRIKYSS